MCNMRRLDLQKKDRHVLPWLASSNHESLPFMKHLKQCGGRRSGHDTVQNLDTLQKGEEEEEHDYNKHPVAGPYLWSCLGSQEG